MDRGLTRYLATSSMGYFANLHLRHLRISRDVAIVLLGEFRFRLAKILTCSVKGSVRHFEKIGMFE